MKRKLTILVLVAGLAGALLATAGAASGSVAGAKLDLVLNDTAGDSFQLIPVGGSATHTQTLTTQACRVNSNGDALVALSASANPNNPTPGLKDHIIGVKAQGEGNGTPCTRIDGNASGRGEQLVIEFAGPTIGDWYADYAQFGVKLKFGASGTIQALLDGEAVEGLFQTVDCTGSDCGPDSGNDRVLFVLDGGGQLFNGVKINVDSPADGSMSLLDDPDAELDSYFTLAADTEAPTITLNGANPLNLVVGDVYVDPGATVVDNVDGVSQVTGLPDIIDTSETGSHVVTYSASDSSGNGPVTITRSVEIFDGLLACGDTKSESNGDVTGTFTRLGVVGVNADCEEIKPYNLIVETDASGGTITFSPEGSVVARYDGTVTFEPYAAANPVPQTLKYDPETDALEFRDMQWCTAVSFDTAGNILSAALPAATAADPVPSWCIVSSETSVFGTSGDIQTTWRAYGEGDPRMSGG